MTTSAGTLRAPMPEGIRREPLPNGVRFTSRWYGPQFLFLAFFCVFWDGFLVMWYAGAASGVDVSRGIDAVGSLEPARIAFLLFPLIHVAVGIGLTYYTLCGFVNRTQIDIAGRAITIGHGPLPWRGNVTVPGTDIQQVYREEVVRHSRNGPRTTYRLSAIRKDQRKLRLLAGLDPDLALFLEQEIEQTLGIRDQPVAGEMRK